MLLIIGCGNILLGDEGIGVYVIDELGKQDLPGNIELLDGGTAGLELLPYIKEADQVILVDSIQAGGKPGDIYKFKPEDYNEDAVLGSFSLHEISLKDVFNTLKQLDIQREITIFAVEPGQVEMKIGLSQEIQAILPKLTDLVLKEADARIRDLSKHS